MPTAMILFSGALPQAAFDILTEDMMEQDPGNPDGIYYIDIEESSTTAPDYIGNIAAEHGIEMVWVCPVQDTTTDGLCHIQIQNAEGHTAHYDGYDTSILVRVDGLMQSSYIEEADAHQSFIQRLQPRLEVSCPQSA